MAAVSTWQNRITRYGDEAPDQLLAHPLNFRLHPKPQQDALAGVLTEVGVVQNIIVNERTGHLIDGHLRVSLAMRQNQPTVPVTYVDLSPEEEALILATLDPISAMAYHDAEQLDALLRDVFTGDAAVMQMLADLAESSGVVPPSEFDPNAEWVGMPEYEQDDMRPVKRLTVSFLSVDAVERFAQLVGQKITMQTDGIYFPPIPQGKRQGIAYVSDDEAAA